MKLIGTQTSPYTRKVRVVLAEKRIDCAFEEDAPGDPNTRVPEFNPLGKVPVLVMDDGSSLYDSRVIVEYLDAASPVTRLLPDVTRERTVGIEQRRRIVNDPPVFAVMPPKAILHHERFTTIEGADVRVHAMLPICVVYTICPTIADLGFEEAPGEVEPRLVEIGAAPVGARNPDG
jgi:glutaredoxin 2